MRILAAVLLSACVLGLVVEDASAARSVQFGIQDDAWLEFGPGTLSARVAKLDRLGLDVVRVTLNWHRAEPRAGMYDWRRPDRLLGALRAGGLRPVVTVWGTPGWANGGGGPNVAPRRAGDFQRFVEEAALRYPYVREWIMWNEPNKATWLRGASPRTYVTRILNPGYRAVKSVSRAAKVAGGVTGPRGGRGGMSPVEFIAGMGRAGAKLDAYAHHPYPVFPEDTPFVGGCKCAVLTLARLERLIRIVDSAFPAARIWLTEYAYQAARRVYAARKVDMLIHYLYRDEPDPARWQSGLETLDGRPKPALYATMFPLAQIGRSGSRITVWGQVRPGEGRQRYVLQQHVRGRWVDIGRSATTDRRGYFRRTVRAAKGTQLRVFYSARRLTSVELSVS
jgi:hypothetical protein